MSGSHATHQTKLKTGDHGVLFCASVANDAEYTLPALLNALVPVLMILLCCCLSLLCAVVLVF